MRLRMCAVVLTLLVAVAVVSPAPFDVAVSAQSGQPKPQDEFVPIDQLPPEQQLPAAPMVVAAYSFVWVAFVAYAFTLVKRVRRIDADLAALERKGR